MSDMITLRGWVGTEPTRGFTGRNEPYTRFRLAVSQSYLDRETQNWVEGHTSWYTVVCYGRIAQNVGESVHKGQRLMVLGKLRIKNFQRPDGTWNMEAELVAESAGHDLRLGLSTWNKRRDEAPRTVSRPSLAHVDGVGAVDLVTGEVPPGGEGDEHEGPFDEQYGGQAEDELGSIQRPHEGSAGEPAPRLLSA